MKRHLRLLPAILLAMGLIAPGLVSAQTGEKKKPNILVIWGDDIGIANISAYSDGVMGYTTPHIDRLAN